MLDFEEYWLNLTQANLEPDNPQWTTLYASIKAEYGLENMSASSWNDVIERMKTDNVLFDKYIQ